MSTPQEAARALVKLNREKLEPVFLKAKAGIILGQFALPSVYSNGNAYVKAAVNWLSAAQQLFSRAGNVLDGDPAGQELDGWYLATQQQVSYLQENNIRGGDPAEAFMVAWVKEVVAEIWAIVKAAVGELDRLFPDLKWVGLAGVVGAILLLALIWKR